MNIPDQPDFDALCSTVEYTAHASLNGDPLGAPSLDSLHALFACEETLIPLGNLCATRPRRAPAPAHLRAKHSNAPKPGGNRAQRRAALAAFLRTPQGRAHRAESGPVWRRPSRLINAYTAALDAWDARFDASVVDTLYDTDGSRIIRARDMPEPPTPDEYGLADLTGPLRTRYSLCQYLYLGVAFPGTPR
jgi:hypothetical protein